MAKVGLIMGSKSDIDIVKECTNTLDAFDIEYDIIISSAHRTPERTAQWAQDADKKGYIAIAAFAGAAAHLAGVVASKTNVPVIAVPIAATALGGLDSLLSSVQMPGGIPVATMAIGKAGAKNAAIFACQIAARSDKAIYDKLEKYRKTMQEAIIHDDENLMSVFNK